MERLQDTIDDIWSKKYENPSSAGRLRWTGSGAVIRHMTSLICGRPCASVQEAIIAVLRDISKRLPYERGLSVACGTGRKEMALLENNIVGHFDCYELSRKAVEEGEREAAKRNLKDRITFHHGDAFAAVFQNDVFDFIYWDNAMHHMLDARAAMRWSKGLLAKNGCFFMYDFVGPTRFQWTGEQIRIIKELLESLDDAYFLMPGGEYMWKKEPSLMSEEEMIRADPSEAADSGNILPAFTETFPKGTILPLGGLVYVLGLDGILVNIPEDSPLLRRLLKLDAMLSRHGHNYYAVAYHVNA